MQKKVFFVVYISVSIFKDVVYTRFRLSNSYSFVFRTNFTKPSEFNNLNLAKNLMLCKYLDTLFFLNVFHFSKF